MTEFFQHSFNVLGHGFVGYLVPFLFVLTVVVFFHELGHFLIARWAGVRVLTFSLGFGPELAGFNDRHGTRWRISAVPLGGYVKFFGDDSEASTPAPDVLSNMTEEERAGSFHHKNVGPRAAIVAAGPIANFLLAIAIFAGVALYFGKPGSIPRVDAIQPDSVAASAGFKIGDVVMSIDGAAIESFADMQRIVSTNAGSQLVFKVRRDDSVTTLSATPALKEVKDVFGNHKIGVLGIQYNAKPGDVKSAPVGYLESLKIGGERAYDRAREGEVLDLAPRPIAIDRLDLVDIPDENHAVFATTVGKGAYIRALARDLGLHLGTHAYVTALKRLSVGGFTLDRAISLDKLEALGHSAATSEHLLPLETALDDIPALALTEDEVRALRCGQAVTPLRPWDRARIDAFADGATIRATSQGRLVALVAIDKGQIRPVRVMNF